METKGRGRPTKTQEQFGANVALRVTFSQYEWLKREAELNNRSQQYIIRELIGEAMAASQVDGGQP